MTLMAPRERGRPVGPVVAEGLAFLSQTLDHALAYWDQIRGTASMPRRDTLVPEEIVALWPHILMVDVLDEGTDYHFRLVGQRLVDTSDEQTDRKLSNAAISEVVRARGRQIFAFCRAHGAPTYASWSASPSDRRPPIDLEALCLPLPRAGPPTDP